MTPSETTSEEKSSRSYWGFVLFRAPDNVKAKFPQFKAVESYGELMGLVEGGDGVRGL